MIDDGSQLRVLGNMKMPLLGAYRSTQSSSSFKALQRARRPKPTEGHTDALGRSTSSPYRTTILKSKAGRSTTQPGALHLLETCCDFLETYVRRLFDQYRPEHDSNLPVVLLSIGESRVGKAYTAARTKKETQAHSLQVAPPAAGATHANRQTFTVHRCHEKRNVASPEEEEEEVKPQLKNLSDRRPKGVSQCRGLRRGSRPRWLCLRHTQENTPSSLPPAPRQR